MNDYGKIVADLPIEVLEIWNSRHVEPEPCEPIDIYWPTSTDPELFVLQDSVMHLLASTSLTAPQERAIALCVLQDCTLREAGEDMGVSASRVQQILKVALRKLRSCPIRYKFKEEPSEEYLKKHYEESLQKRRDEHLQNFSNKVFSLLATRKGVTN